MNRTLQLLGLARRAGKILYGEEILNQFREGKIQIVFIASDISEKSRERILKKCSYYNTPYTDVFSAEELSAAVGKRNVRSLALTDRGFAENVLKEGGCVHGESTKKQQ